MARAGHWDKVHASRPETELTWFQERPEPSLSLVTALGRREVPVIDVGGGASRLAGALLAQGFRDLTVLDLSETALDVARTRLGARAGQISWVAADVTRWRPDRRFGLWHDRAVFHFLTDAADRAAYVEAMRAALLPGGHAIIATFDRDGPQSCSGLPVRRYAPEALVAEFNALAPGLFAPVLSRRHAHRSPGGTTQRFQTSVFRKVG